MFSPPPTTPTADTAPAKAKPPQAWKEARALAALSGATIQQLHACLYQPRAARKTRFGGSAEHEATAKAPALYDSDSDDPTDEEWSPKQDGAAPSPRKRSARTPGSCEEAAAASPKRRRQGSGKGAMGDTSLGTASPREFLGSPGQGSANGGHRGGAAGCAPITNKWALCHPMFSKRVECPPICSSGVEPVRMVREDSEDSVGVVICPGFLANIPCTFACGGLHCEACLVRGPGGKEEGAWL